MRLKPTAGNSGFKGHLLVAALLVVTGMLLPATSAWAVWGGTLDGNAHRNVGIVFTERTNPKNDLTGGGPPDVIGGDHCNGVLIAAKLVLTIMSCVGDPWDKYAYVSFAPDYNPLYDWGPSPYLKENNGESGAELGPWQKGAPICREPCYRGEIIRASRSDNGPRALAILKLDKSPVAVENIQPALLPAFNSLSNLLGTTVTSVGYNDVACEFGVQAWDCADLIEDDNTFDTPFENSIIPGRHIHLTERRSGDMVVLNVGQELIDLDAELNCDDIGGGYFAAGILVALTPSQDGCDTPQALRLDTHHARTFLCQKQKFPDLKNSPLCSTQSASAVAQANDPSSADTPTKHDSKKKKHKNKKHSKSGGHKGKKRGR